MKTIITILLFNTLLFPQIKFEDHFLDKALRIDYFHTGNFENEYYSIDELIEEPFWSGSKINLEDKFNYGKYKVVIQVYLVSGKLQKKQSQHIVALMRQ